MTGALLFSEGYFCQILEGERAAVEEIFSAAPRQSRCEAASEPQASKQLGERRVGGLGAPFEDFGSRSVVASQDLERAPSIRQRGLLGHLQALVLEVAKLLKFGHCDSSDFSCIFELSAPTA
ncbi:BLUF domain-containing protein [Bradyrhizobium sp. CCBAU 53421]|uniref:BLUF domain-containing protein n=1 Tax=Bradyrhizobium sp. CCBAU 53421 TaxID=1325120 RepID=UPI00188BDF9D|nr:BLUF domain-containing protein [Bradyrhizobium sp. CCBAU 53421]QOZ34444.1 hypothetical protein XH92_24585 [Bradyrhizobium sp. CCBAU 53421]